MAKHLYCPHCGAYVGNCGHVPGVLTNPVTLSGTCGKCERKYSVTCKGDCLDKKGSDADHRHDSCLYSALMAHYLHQDHLLWSRTQLLIAVQAAVLATGFSQRGHWLAPAIMLFGALLTFLIMLLVIKDRADRNVNLPIMDKLSDALLPDGIKDELRQEKKATNIQLTKTLRFRFICGRYITIRGWYIIKSVLIMFIFIDILLAVLYNWASCLFP